MWHKYETIQLSKSLVTRGEYQLFLDEMRAQGKYYQPDHWSSHQFITGKADEPVLGVRPSDAVAYCDWLTAQEHDGWRFRLPSVQEGERAPLERSAEKPTGYWVVGGQFIWIGNPPGDARKLDLFRAFTLDIERFDANIADRERARGRVFNLLRVFKLEQVLSRALDLDNDLSLARMHAREHAGVLQLDVDPALATHIDQALDRDLDRALDLARALDRAVERSSALKHARAHAFQQALEFERAIDRTLAIDLFIYIDLLTLHERIAGRSPAFEGIGIVKERMSAA